MSPEYISSIAVLIVGILQLFGVAVEKDAIAGLIVGILGLYLAFTTKKAQRLNVFGMRKN